MALLRTFSIAAAGALALCTACSSAAPRDTKTPPAPQLGAPDAGAPTTPSPAPVGTAPASVPAQPLLQTGTVFNTPEPELPRAAPLAALSQMVTAQALLVSMFLAPVSKDGAQTIARSDTSGASARR